MTDRPIESVAQVKRIKSSVSQ